MNRWLWRLAYLAGGLSFWLPDIAIHALRRSHFGESRFDLLSVLLLPIAASVVALELLFRARTSISSRGAIALWMLLGIWFFGPLCMGLGATFAGAGFTQPGTGPLLLWGLVGFIPLTFMFSAYDASMGALICTTVAFFIVGLVSRRRPS